SLDDSTIRVVYEIPRPVEADASLLPIAALSELPPVIMEYLTRTGGVRSQVGEPLCLFPHALSRVLVERLPLTNEMPPDATFPATCAGCVLKPLCPGISAAYIRQFGVAELRPFVGEAATERADVALVD